MDIIEYNAKIEWLYKQAPSFQVIGEKAYHPGLEPMIRFDKKLGEPSKKIKSIHIAGTNGKGSTSHILAAALSSLGKKVGIYSSPHLIDFRERVKIISSDDYKLIEKEEVLSFLNNHEDYINRENLSFFEVTTAMAFSYFESEKVDIAIIETGLGGRLDSTNIINPLICAITSISLDHSSILGNTLEDIAAEKAGIIKKNTPVVLGEIPEVAVEIIRKKAISMNSPLHSSDRHKSLEDNIIECMDLRGVYQDRNLRTTFKILEVLEKILPNQYSIKTLNAIKNTANKTFFRGRWEILSNKPKIIADIAHNEEGLKITMNQLSKLFETGLYKRMILIFGIMRDKEFNPDLLPKNAYYYYTQAQGERALSSTSLSKKIGLNGETTKSVLDAINKYMENSNSKDLVYIGGSSFIVAEALSEFDKKKNIF